MTTERRIRLTVQNRLTIAVAILSVLTLTIVGFVLYTVESNNVESRNTSTMSQEIAEMRSFAQTGVDPETGRPFASVDHLLSQFLAQNQPNADEAFFAFLTDGRVLYQGDSEPLLRESKEFEKEVAAVAEAGGRIALRIGKIEYEGYVLPVATDRAGREATGGATASPPAGPVETRAGTPAPAEASGGTGTKPASFVVMHNVSASRADLTQVMQIYIVVALAAAILISGISSILARRLLQPVTELRRTAQSISGGDLGKRLSVVGNDDIAELGRTFNAMLDRLEAAFVAQRTFLDDAGHELRTPLTVLRGHLEIMDVDDADDVAETQALLLDETDRMSRLVDELLLLARSRRPDFVRPETVDVAHLLQDVLAKARALGTRDWTLDEVDDIAFTADRQRLTQALLQLAANSVDHTDEGDTIAFGARLDGDEVHLWVRDEGAGVSPEIADGIFERFRRGTDKGDGFGLGLSIIRAIAEAHGGTVVLDDTEVGAQFRMILPKGAE